MNKELLQRQITDILVKMLDDDGIHQIICSEKNLTEQGIDSFRHLKLFVELEKRFGIQLTERMFSEGALTSVRGLALLIGDLLPEAKTV